MSILSSAGRSLTSSLRTSLRSPALTGSRLASSSATGPSASEVAPAGQTVKDLIPEDAKDLVSAEVVSGAPRTQHSAATLLLTLLTLDSLSSLLFSLLEELQHRAVRIFQPTRNTMQSGGAKGEKWRIDFDVLQGGGRWENPLMGWASSYVSIILFVLPWLNILSQCGLHARDTRFIHYQGRCYSLRREAR